MRPLRMLCDVLAPLIPVLPRVLPGHKSGQCCPVPNGDNSTLINTNKVSQLLENDILDKCDTNVMPLLYC